MDKWQPIESADAVTALLLWDEDFGMVTGLRYDGAWLSVLDSFVVLKPTHWMPLPNPPKPGTYPDSAINKEDEGNG